MRVPYCLRYVLFFVLLVFRCSAFGQVDNNQMLVDSLRYVSRMPYICEDTGFSNCGDEIFWKVVKQKETIIPYLLKAMDDTNLTKATVPNFGGNNTVSDICYGALQEIVHHIPTFEIAGVKFDTTGCGYCSFWLYIREFGNRVEFKKRLTHWYDQNKQNLVWAKSNDFEICECSGKHPNGGHYEWRKQ